MTTTAKYCLFTTTINAFCLIVSAFRGQALSVLVFFLAMNVTGFLLWKNLQDRPTTEGR